MSEEDRIKWICSDITFAISYLTTGQRDAETFDGANVTQRLKDAIATLRQLQSDLKELLP